MSYRELSKDNRFMIHGNLAVNDVLIGQEVYKTQNGANYSPGEAKDTPHPYSMTSFMSYLPPVTQFDLTPGSNIWWYAHPPGPAIRQPNWTSNDEIALINKLREKFNDSEFNAPVAIGELGKAVDMVAQRTRQGIAAYKQARHGNFAAAAKTLGSNSKDIANRKRKRAADRQRVTDLQLEVQYGFRALASDVYELAKTIDDVSKRTRRIFVKHMVGGEISTAVPGYDYTGTTSDRRSIVAFIDIDDASFVDRMGLKEPLSLLWEITPWSFFIDWALPIGSWLSAQQFAFNTKGSFVRTEKYYVYFRGTGFTGIDNPGIRTEYYGGHVQESVSFSRTILTQLSVPLPSWKSDLLGGEPLNRLANAFALLVGVKNRMS